MNTFIESVKGPLNVESEVLLTMTTVKTLNLKWLMGKRVMLTKQIKSVFSEANYFTTRLFAAVGQVCFLKTIDDVLRRDDLLVSAK